MKYVVAVADLFLARCQNINMLSPVDFVTISEWEKQEIPLEIVLRSINEVCDEGVKISSANGFQGRVKQNFVEWLKVRGRSIT